MKEIQRYRMEVFPQTKDVHLYKIVPWKYQIGEWCKFSDVIQVLRKIEKEHNIKILNEIVKV